MSDVIISIEPRLPPAMCGTSTYGWTLSRHWPEANRRFVHLVVDGAEASRRHFGTEQIHDVGQSAARLYEQLKKHPGAGVILHYASRGFHRYGVPLWLARGLGKWRCQHRDARLLVFFHEVPQRLPATSRHYVLERLNRIIIKRLARLADVIVTNTPEHAERLGRLTGRSEIPWLWVPSNIPAPQNPDSSFASRNTKDFVIFGLPFTQLLTAQAFAEELKTWHWEGVIERLHLIGPTDAKFSPQVVALLAQILPGDAVIRHGSLEPPAVSRILQSAGFCLTQSNAENFSKSTTFAAFPAHGCAVVAKMGSEAAIPPLCHLIHPEELPTLVRSPGFSEISSRARALAAWYAENADWPVVATHFARMFRASHSQPCSRRG